MENTWRYIINIKITGDEREYAFFKVLREIDPHPLTVVSNNAYAIKSELGISTIFKLLSATLVVEDMLLIIPIIDNKYEAQSPEFTHWIKFGD